MPFGRRHPLLGHPVPPRASAPLTIGLPGLPARTPTGFPRSTHARHDRGGPPSTPRPAVFTRPAAILRSPLAASTSGQALPPGSFIPPLRAHFHEASTGVYSRSPVRSSPRPVAPPDGRGPLGFSLELRTPGKQDLPGARRGGDRSRTLIGNYAPGITGLQSACSLNMRDLVSHTAGNGVRATNLSL